MPKTITVTVTETETRLAIDGPPPTATRGQHTREYPPSAPLFQQVALPAFTSALTFILTLIAVFVATTFVAYLALRARTEILEVYHQGPKTPPDEKDGKKTAEAEEEEERLKAQALRAGTVVMLSHALTVLVLVLKTREALETLPGVSYEVFMLILGIETSVAAIVGGGWVLGKMAK